MKKALAMLLVALSLVGIATVAGSVSNAKADRAYDALTCNESSNGVIDSGNPTLTYRGTDSNDNGLWTSHYYYVCGGSNRTFEWEIQYSADGGSHWYDLGGINGNVTIDHTKTVDGSGTYTASSTSNLRCVVGQNVEYRAKMWGIDASGVYRYDNGLSIGDGC